MYASIHAHNRLERLMNWEVVWLVVILLVLCVASAIGAWAWLTSDDHLEAPFYYRKADDRNPEMLGEGDFFLMREIVIIPFLLFPPSRMLASHLKTTRFFSSPPHSD
jgi:hypothetical protein